MPAWAYVPMAEGSSSDALVTRPGAEGLGDALQQVLLGPELGGLGIDGSTGIHAEPFRPGRRVLLGHELSLPARVAPAPARRTAGGSPARLRDWRGRGPAESLAPTKTPEGTQDH